VTAKIAANGKVLRFGMLRSLSNPPSSLVGAQAENQVSVGAGALENVANREFHWIERGRAAIFQRLAMTDV
jgi:hypothetical protein